MSIREIIEGMVRVEEYNDQFRQPNLRGRYPECKPAVFSMRCERCGRELRDQKGPCPLVPPEERWGEDWN